VTNTRAPSLATATPITSTGPPGSAVDAHTPATASSFSRPVRAPTNTRLSVAMSKSFHTVAASDRNSAAGRAVALVGSEL
jgi:hypothetical protein